MNNNKLNSLRKEELILSIASIKLDAYINQQYIGIGEEEINKQAKLEINNNKIIKNIKILNKDKNKLANIKQQFDEAFNQNEQEINNNI